MNRVIRIAAGIALVLSVFNTIGLFCLKCPTAMTVVGGFVSAAADVATIGALLFAFHTFWRNGKDERIRKTIDDFPAVRQALGNLQERLEHCPRKLHRRIKKEYATKMDRFAVGVNNGAYDLKIVNQMSGGVLIQHYEQHMAMYIDKARKRNSGEYVNTSDLYANYETMIRELYKLRGHKKKGD